ncbi:Uncharacterised protein [Mycobacteroides abscessus subsp. abscessus]|uniref:hypothetical protein n=1 Tax=Mycobacteroides abscessus TaxID=36809 RepID=UPI00092947B4|nr:hypothetical protein [Mycobacteroides abscessus]SHT00385.1 Uncharacterised protein [Mycobacteroides abscessus subsp. abscessus]SHT24496.1 Uncharacterised protein [Mycobacteroides abscessus subsp. abscessus]SHT62178.1 Uncharacterised protein [Mycobacteroides abscessus subsp. abscessus]SHX77949.1 Uncharacterised protein [Mycobacteroides abscessus subsp. abscessus]SIB42617.1 Uncharacterised protein [Mycobacteroides abscessus subsp. abscessus]
MTFTTTTWVTTSVERLKPDYVVVHSNPSGAQRGIEANLVLTQMNGSGGRRTILGVVDPATCEVIAAPDVDGYEGLLRIEVWRSRRVALAVEPPTMPKSDATRWLEGER